MNGETQKQLRSYKRINDGGLRFVLLEGLLVNASLDLKLHLTLYTIAMKSKIALLTALMAVSFLSKVYSAEQAMTVYKTPTCGCCQKWVDHMSDNNFSSKVVEMDDLLSIKTKYNIEGRYRSCHTGVVVSESGDYVFEGHVPAEQVAAFLAKPPKDAIGLAVPGMPLGSPGMEVGDRKDYYQVLLIKTDGSSTVYAHVNQ